MEFVLTEPGLNCYVEALGISADNTRVLFRLLDVDNSGRIDLEEFSEGCLRLQGEAKSIDVHTLIYQIKKFLTKWSDFTKYIDDRFMSLGVVAGADIGEWASMPVSMRGSVDIVTMRPSHWPAS